MRERRIAIAVIALLVLATAWDRQPTVDVALNPAVAPAAVTAQTQVDLGVLGTIVLGWTAKRLVAR